LNRVDSLIVPPVGKDQNENTTEQNQRRRYAIIKPGLLPVFEGEHQKLCAQELKKTSCKKKSKDSSLLGQDIGCFKLLNYYRDSRNHDPDRSEEEVASNWALAFITSDYLSYRADQSTSKGNKNVPVSVLDRDMIFIERNLADIEFCLRLLGDFV
jgi:hypothetical protein